MFTLKLYDREGRELKIGDIVKISNGREFSFFCEVKYLEKEKAITPFHTFSFHSVVKIDKLPPNVKESTEERYKIWYHWNEEAEVDAQAERFQKFLMDWRECESAVEKRMYRIELNKT